MQTMEMTVLMETQPRKMVRMKTARMKTVRMKTVRKKTVRKMGEERYLLMHGYCSLLKRTDSFNAGFSSDMPMRTPFGAQYVYYYIEL